jgi:hypothetical protein
MSMEQIGRAMTDMTDISERLTSDSPDHACDSAIELRNEKSTVSRVALRYALDASRSLSN